MSESKEDFCGKRFKGAGTRWECSLNHKHLGPHVAYAWHDVSTEPIAIWRGNKLYYREF